MFLPPGFDRAIALEAAALVNQAYDQFHASQNGQPWNLAGNYDTLGLLSATPPGLFARPEPFGFVARNQASRNVFVTFRGTDSLGDWISDFSVPQKQHPWGQAELGFTDLYNQCLADVQAFVGAAGAAPNVFVTGHSLGAGLAVLAMADLVISGVAPTAAMYSFAGPRVGDLDFARNFNAQVAVAWRIVNTEDVVTTVPIATPVLLNPGGNPLSPIRIALRALQALNYEHVGAPVSFTTHQGSIEANHAMQVYINAL